MAGHDCKPCAARGAARAGTFRIPADGAAAQAGAGSQYTVLTASGASTGRTFTSLLAAQQYAQRIGGTTRPV